jgi:hypothetical protein
MPLQPYTSRARRSLRIGGPGERPYHPGYYAAFLFDPDGNNIEVVFHGRAVRSAGCVQDVQSLAH